MTQNQILNGDARAIAIRISETMFHEMPTYNEETLEDYVWEAVKIIDKYYPKNTVSCEDVLRHLKLNIQQQKNNDSH